MRVVQAFSWMIFCLCSFLKVCPTLPYSTDGHLPPSPRCDLPLDPHLAHHPRKGARPPLRLGGADHRAALVRTVAGLPGGPVPAERHVPATVRVPRGRAHVRGQRAADDSWVCDPAEPWPLCSNPARGRGAASDYNSDPRLGELGLKLRRPPTRSQP